MYTILEPFMNIEFSEVDIITIQSIVTIALKRHQNVFISIYITVCIEFNLT